MSDEFIIDDPAHWRSYPLIKKAVYQSADLRKELVAFKDAYSKEVSEQAVKDFAEEIKREATKLFNERTNEGWDASDQRYAQGFTQQVVDQALTRVIDKETA